MPSIRIIAAAFVALCSSAQAQDWPTRPVTMVVPFAAGGAFDVMARIFAPHLSQSMLTGATPRPVSRPPSLTHLVIAK